MKKMNETKGIESTLSWHQAAHPTSPSEKQSVALGVHFEEVAEMMEALGLDAADVMVMENIATRLKQKQYPLEFSRVNRKELLDALCDQVVTSTGVAHMFKMDILSGLDEVNRSNWSKFVDGKPQFDVNGKITKSANYSKPDLTGLYEEL